MTAIIFDTETHDKEEPEIIEASWLEVDFGNPTIPKSKLFVDESKVESIHGDIVMLRQGASLRDVARSISGPFTQRFQPSKPITLGAMATHNIMDEDLLGCDPSAIFELPPCDFVIGHNVDFDAQAAGIMATETNAAPLSAPRRIDTCAMARACWPDLDCYSQSALIYHLDRKNARERLKGAHGAAADVLLCKTILDACIAHSNARSWEELWAFSEEARIPKVMYFGKHKDMAIADLPRDYVAWLLRLPDLDQYLRKALTGNTKQRTMFCPQ